MDDEGEMQAWHHMQELEQQWPQGEEAQAEYLAWREKTNRGYVGDGRIKRVNQCYLTE